LRREVDLRFFHSWERSDEESGYCCLIAKNLDPSLRSG
jgi:hypothetical protein